MKLLFAPFRFISSRLAGVTARRLIDRLWGLVDEQQPPQPEDRRSTWPKLAASLLIQGAVFRLVSGLTDHAARQWFARLTGRWPGEKEPKKD
jgi:Protein of unknown function (DUF4235)